MNTKFSVKDKIKSEDILEQSNYFIFVQGK